MPGSDSIAGASPFRTFLEGIALALLWVPLYLPNLAEPEFQNEEGRRVIPAREMVASGNYVRPTIFGRPYIAKPPAFYWTVAVVGGVRGTIDETSARLPSALATLASAWTVLALAARFLPWSSAFSGAVLFLLTPLVLEKGTLAEIEALLGTTLFAASALAWIGSRGKPAATAASALLLAFAVLSKGPAAWVFFLATLFAAAWVDRARARPVLLTGGIVLVASTALAGLWLALLVQDLGWTRLTETWAREVTGGSRGPGYWMERGSFVLNSLGAFGLGTLLLFFALLHPRGRFWLESPLVRIALGTSALAFGFFLVFPRAQARYLYPLAPWLSILAGHVLSRACEPSAPRAAASLVRGFVILSGTLGVLVLITALARSTGLVQFDFEIGPAGLALAVATGVLSLALFRVGKRSPWLGLALSLSILALGRVLQLVEVGPRPADLHERRDRAARIDAALPGNVATHTMLWSDFNLFAHVVHPIVFTEDPLAVPVGDTLLSIEEGPAEPQPPEWSLLGRIPLEKSRSVVVSQRLAPAAGAR